ncbi:MAG: hypothetical protein WCK75_05135 [Elusimicrobiota bacterium]
MTSVDFSFWVLGVLAFLAACYGMKRYRTPLNPLTIFTVTQIGMFTILSGVVATHLTPKYTSADIVKTILVSIVYLCATTLPYLFHGSLLSNLYGKGLGLFGLNSESIALRFNAIKFVLLLVGAVSAFTALALVGGGGMLWLTNSRAAYISYRAGAGPFFALTQWLLTFAMVYCIWTIKPRVFKLLPILSFFCAAMYFLGSKNNVLLLPVIGLAYYNFYIRRISFMTFTMLAPLFFLAVLGLLVADGVYSSLMNAGLYFRDYFDTTAQFLSRFDEFGFRYGRGWLSSLWSYVPRALYHDKPYEYGVLLVHQVFFPGAAALGNTPGFLSWTLDYLDFGVIGVFFSGLLGGIWQRMAYEYFLNHKQQFFAFILAMQFSIWSVWTFAPLPILIVWSLSQSVFLKLVWRQKNMVAQ